LVTGAGGFIGSNLVERLVALGARTRALVRYNSAGSWGWLEGSPVKDDVQVFLGDVRDPGSLRQPFSGVETVFHLAALIAIPYSYQAPLSYVQTNIEGTLNVLQAAADAGVSLVVHTSTSEVYGTACYVPMDEHHPLRGQSPYSASKIGADKLAEAFYHSYQLPVAIIRPFNTYGPRQSARAIIPTVILQVLTQPEVRLGNLDPTRDFTYVDDMVDAFINVAEHSQAVGQVTNFGSGQETSIRQLVATVLEITGKTTPIVSEEERVRPQSSEVQRLCADNTRARQIIGWRPQYPLKEGLAKTICWVEENLGRFHLGEYVI
jgi:dTDP-glucose 4,6-dehydratase